MTKKVKSQFDKLIAGERFFPFLSFQFVYVDGGNKAYRATEIPTTIIKQKGKMPAWRGGDYER